MVPDHGFLGERDACRLGGFEEYLGSNSLRLKGLRAMGLWPNRLCRQPPGSGAGAVTALIGASVHMASGQAAVAGSPGESARWPAASARETPAASRRPAIDDRAAATISSCAGTSLGRDALESAQHCRRQNTHRCARHDPRCLSTMRPVIGHRLHLTPPLSRATSVVAAAAPVFWCRCA